MKKFDSFFRQAGMVLLVLSVLICMVIFQLFIIRISGDGRLAFAAEALQNVELERAEDGYFLIEDFSDLEKTISAINSGGNVTDGDVTESAVSASFRLTADIVVNDGEFLYQDGLKYKPTGGSTGDVPSTVVSVSGIGNTTYKFGGRFDGGNYRIIGYYSTTSPLFYRVSGATIYDLHIAGAVTAAQSSGFVHTTAGETTIYNCSFSGVLVGAKSGGFIRAAKGDVKLVNCLANTILLGTVCSGFVYTVDDAAIINNCVANVMSSLNTYSGFTSDNNYNSAANCKSSGDAGGGGDIEFGITNWGDEIDQLNNADLSTLVDDAEFAKWSYNDGVLSLSLEEEVKEYTISYEDFEGNTISSTKIIENTSITIADNLIEPIEGYEFFGWDTTGDGVADYKTGDTFIVDKDVTLVAVYKQIPKTYYQVTYVVDDVVVEEFSKEEGSLITAIAAAKTGFSFLGWDIDNDLDVEYQPNETIEVVDALRLEAIFEEIPAVNYTVTYMQDGTVLQQFEVEESEAVVLIEGQEKEGYIFIGWDKNGDKNIDYDGGQTVTVTEALTLRAVYQELPKVYYEVKYIVDGITIYDEDIEAAASIEVLEGTEKEGCRFLGWDAGADNIVDYAAGQTIQINASITLRAIYEELPKTYFSVVYMVDGAIEESFSIEEGENITTIDGTIKDGYTFLGWDVDGDGSFDYASGYNIRIEEGLTLSAIYIAIPRVYYTVSFAVGDDVVEELSIEEGLTAIAIAGTAKEKHTFLGWDLDDDNIADIDEGQSIVVIGDTVLKAVYAKDKENYSITYVSDEVTSGTLPVDNTIYDEGSEIFVLGNTGGLSLDGHMFSGWDIDDDGIADYVGGEQIIINQDIVLKAVFEELSVLSAAPDTLRFEQGIASWQYSQVLDSNHCYEICLYDDEAELLATSRTTTNSEDFRSNLLDIGKGSYYFTVVVIDLEIDAFVSETSALSPAQKVYKITAQKGTGTILDVPMFAMPNTEVSVTVQLYAGYENLIITADEQEIENSFYMPDKDVVVSTSAVMVEDCVADFKQILEQLADEFSLDNYALIKEADSIIAALVDEQKADLDLSKLLEAKLTYEEVVEEVFADYSDVKILAVKDAATASPVYALPAKQQFVYQHKREACDV